MFSILDRQPILRRLLFTIALLAALISIGVLINAVAAKRVANPYELAHDLPRGALVYAQFRDLPALLRQWNDSELKQRYLASASFEHLQTRHLAIKLAARWQEFNDATGFPIDTGVLSALADNRAAIAIYDIGRLDLVLIAPLSEEKQLATQFFQSKDSFEEIELPDGAAYHLHDVEADRGRQKQQIGFAAVNGKFVLATNEKLLLRTITNLKGQRKKDRLTDEPSFQSLAMTVAPHFATVWVDQAKLNEDWYFKHYWLMNEVAELKHLHAGMFDIELRQGQWIERREFLTDGKQAKPRAALSAETRRQIAGIVPDDVPFIQMRAAEGDSASSLLGGALFDGKAKPPETRRGWNWGRYDASDFEVSPEEGGYDGSSRYSYLSHRYDLFVDDPDDAEEWEENGIEELRLDAEQRSLSMLRASLSAAHPLAAAKVARPKAIEGPLFAEFGRASVVVLQTPSALNARALEQAIEQLAANRLMIAGASSKAGAHFEWKDRRADGGVWREMVLPALGRSVGYGLRGRMLIVSNSLDLLRELMTHNSLQAARPSASSAREVTMIRFSQRAESFDRIFAKLDAPRVEAYWKSRKGDQSRPSDPSKEFFSGEISSLLDTVSPVEEVRIERSYTPGRMREEVALVMK